MLHIPATHSLSSEILASCEIWHKQNDAAWSRAKAAVQANKRLRLAVLGTSPSSGCGAAENVEKAVFQPSAEHNRSIAGRMCEPARSWVRHLKDFLTRRFGDAATHVEVTPKNAVGPEWFTRCTSTKVSEDDHIVLLETLTNVFGNDLRKLLQSVRHAAPLAAIAFVMWPNFDGLYHKDINRVRMLEAADSDGSDAIDIGKVIRLLRLGGNGTTPSFYAMNGRDKVHPNPGGHQLIGSLVAHYVHRRLMNADDLVCHEGKKHKWGRNFSRSAGLINNYAEVCYDSAESLPVLNQSGFTLIDEGGVKQVLKTGYVSHHVGDVLTLGPLAPPPSSECAVVVVTIGYLLSSTRQHQGAFAISCRGCQCSSMPQTFQEELYPFPVVETDAKVARSSFVNSQFSITASTEMLALVESAKNCTVHISHVRSRGVLNVQAFTSRIRIDSLTLTGFGLDYIKHGLQRHSSPAQKHLLNKGMNCSS